MPRGVNGRTGQVAGFVLVPAGQPPWAAGGLTLKNREREWGPRNGGALVGAAEGGKGVLRGGGQCWGWGWGWQ